jgi:hypothetical protein
MWRRRASIIEMFSGSGIRYSSSPHRTGTRHSQFDGPGPAPASRQRGPLDRLSEAAESRRIVFSDGRIAASVQLSAVGSEPCLATNSRRAPTDSSIRVLAKSDNCTASPSNTSSGVLLWDLRSTTTTSGIHQAQRGGVRSGACCHFWTRMNTAYGVAVWFKSAVAHFQIAGPCTSPTNFTAASPI